MSEIDSKQHGSLTDMYEDYFLDYASYVILERAVPSIQDGLKPVQRRILHAMREMHDGRYHKVANIIGQTMQYHPHGDAAIGDALVNLGQKDLLIDPQGNWGDVRTGDSAAAPRYIEARLTPFALDVAFNPKTTEWQLSYDGRNKEPIDLPMKFPLVLAQGVEGIAVGLSTKILPHNFIELIEGSIKLLKGKKVTLYPDFATGGKIDVSEYNNGKRGGRVKVRCAIEIADKSKLLIKDLPYGVTTDAMIDSIVKANDKGKIKIKNVVDNTAKEVEIEINLPSGTSPELTMDALYAFTRCEESISPNACIIIDDKPHFITVEEILARCTEQTKALLLKELEIKKAELEEQILFSSLVKIFIEKRIYRDIEEAETWEQVIQFIDDGLHKYVSSPNRPLENAEFELIRDVTEQDIVKLTEIRIKRISKYNTFEAEEKLRGLQEDLQQVLYDIEHIVDYTIDYYQNLLEKYGEGKERKTEITTFETIERTMVVANNAKLYVDRKGGFIGTGIKKEEFVMECSDIDDIIVFLKNGKFKVVRIDEKVYVGKGVEYVSVWHKGDERTTYNMIYTDGKTGRTYGKRFHVKSITRDREYDLTTGEKGSKMLYFSANPNGEAELMNIQLTKNCRARKKNLQFDFSELDIKGRGAKGNTITKYPVFKVTVEEEGKSTLGALKVWMDEASGRLNLEERGKLIGEYDTGDQILVLNKDGSYQLKDLDLNLTRIQVPDIKWVGKFDPDMVLSAIYYDGERDWTLIKRFQIETSSVDQKFPFITEHKKSKLLEVFTERGPVVRYEYKDKGSKEQDVVKVEDFIDVKGWKAIGNKLVDGRIKILNTNFLPPSDEELEIGTQLELSLDDFDPDDDE